MYFNVSCFYQLFLSPQEKHLVQPNKMLYIIISRALSVVRKERPRHIWELKTLKVVILFYIKPTYTISQIYEFPGALKLPEKKDYTCKGNKYELFLVCLGQTTMCIPQPVTSNTCFNLNFLLFLRNFASWLLFMKWILKRKDVYLSSNLLLILSDLPCDFSSWGIYSDLCHKQTH